MFAVSNIVFILTLFTLLPSFVSLPAFALPFPVGTQPVKTRRAFDLDRSDRAAYVLAHNIIRAQYNAPPLTWSPSLAAKATAWADMCMFQHSDGILDTKPYGENIVAATGDYWVEDAMNTLISTRDQYNPASPTYTQFTQLIWKSTTQVGCAIARCDGIIDQTVTLHVCLYDPPGNVVGALPPNVEA
ncbi:PR-1-like protein [Coprinopsis marcescibilis]|uniref:PR-1-like protein n=1 Tax=Coprinopsis marcescibilis TaxID=230819 RepID=A0A5C3KJL3_COPMA|nr:PR-1-like protein [Coprinopsis marcescibilis]